MTGSLGELPPHLVEGIRLFHAGAYLPAHETLEEYWIDAPGPERAFYQGLIQLATGFHHLTRGNPRGARLQFAKARKHLEGYPSVHLGVEVERLRRFLDNVEVAGGAEGVVPPRLTAT